MSDQVPAELVHHWLQGATATWQLEDQSNYRARQGLPPREVRDYYVHVLGPPNPEDSSERAKVQLENVPRQFHNTGGHVQRLKVYAMMLNEVSEGDVSEQFGETWVLPRTAFVEAHTLLTLPLFNAFPWSIANISAAHSSRGKDGRLCELHGKVIFVQWKEFVLQYKSVQQRQGTLRDLTAPTAALTRYVGLEERRSSVLSEKQWQEQGNGVFLGYLFRWLAAHMRLELDVKTEEQTAPEGVSLEAFAESLWRNFAEAVHKLVVRPDYLFLPKPAEGDAKKTSSWAYAAVELKRPEQLCLRQYVQQGSVEAFIDFFCDKQFSIIDIQARFDLGRLDPMLQLLGYMVKKRTLYGILTDGVIFCFVRLRRVTSNSGQLPDTGTAQDPFRSAAQPPAPNGAQAKPGENEKVQFNAMLHFGCYKDTNPTVVEQLLTWLEMATTGDDVASWPHFPELNPEGADTGLKRKQQDVAQADAPAKGKPARHHHTRRSFSAGTSGGASGTARQASRQNHGDGNRDAGASSTLQEDAGVPPEANLQCVDHQYKRLQMLLVVHQTWDEQCFVIECVMDDLPCMLKAAKRSSAVGEELENEIGAHDYLQHAPHSHQALAVLPKVLFSGYCDEIDGFCLATSVVRSMHHELLSQHKADVRTAFEQLWACKMSHGDIALRNLGFHAGQVCILDLGRARVHETVDGAIRADILSLNHLLRSV